MIKKITRNAINRTHGIKTNTMLAPGIYLSFMSMTDRPVLRWIDNISEAGSAVWDLKEGHPVFIYIKE